jgi:hypothetical protein
LRVPDSFTNRNAMTALVATTFATPLAAPRPATDTGRGAAVRLALASLVFAALPVAAGGLPAPADAAREYARHAAAADACRDGETLVLGIPATPDAGFETVYDAASGHLRARYRMAYNDITEGWNWHPADAMAGGDYYTFKYLQLASELEDGRSYRGEDKIGSPQEFRVQTRYDYFFAFDNPYEFYRREDGDDAGFAAEFDVAADDATRLAGGDLRMALRARLRADCVSSSTTFWKATAARPVDFTLKKRYLVGRIAEVWFFDAASGRILAQQSARLP